MSRKRPDDDSIALRTENERLLARLAEMEELLRAIRAGDVDALVADDGGRAQVFSLRGEESVYRVFVETMREAATLVGRHGEILFCNNQMSRLVDRSAEELLASRVVDLVCAEDQAVFGPLLEKAAREGVDGDVRLLNRQGERVATHVSLAPLPEAEYPGVCAVWADLRDVEVLRDFRQRMERLLEESDRSRRALLSIVEDERRATRRLKVIGASNRALLNQTDETALLQDACRIAVEIAGYRSATVFVPHDDAAKSLALTAHSGTGLEHLQSLDFTWADTERGQGTIGRAVRSGVTQVSLDALADSRLAAWKTAVEKLGCKAALSLPLKNAAGAVFAVLSICAAERGVFDEDETSMLQELADDLGFGILTLRARTAHEQLQQEHSKNVERLKQSLTDTIRAIALTVEMRDPYTAGHQRRVAELAEAISREMKIPEETIEGLHLAGVVHDLGKIHIPAEILSKPGRLSAVEFELVKGHSQAGADILRGVDFPWPIADIVLQHHERLDGSGYPQGLKGDAILPEAKILAVADVVEAMSSHRPYRPGLGLEAALDEITRGRGTIYDAAAVDACLSLFRERNFTWLKTDK